MSLEAQIHLCFLVVHTASPQSVPGHIINRRQAGQQGRGCSLMTRFLRVCLARSWHKEDWIFIVSR